MFVLLCTVYLGIATARSFLLGEHLQKHALFFVDERGTGDATRFVHPFGGEVFECWYPKESEQESQTKRVELDEAELSRRALPLALSLGCVRKGAGWWTYELCASNGQILLDQFHVEQRSVTKHDNSVGQNREAIVAQIGDTFSLGRSRVGDSGRVDLSRHPPTFVMSLDDGTVCDLTGDPRRTDVHYHCAPDTPNPTIVHFSEPSSCSYLVRVDAAALCEAEELRPDHEQVARIECVPAEGDEAAATAVAYALDVAEAATGRRETTFVDYTQLIYEEPNEPGPLPGMAAASGGGRGRVRAPDAEGRARRDLLLANGWVTASATLLGAEAGLSLTPRRRSSDDELSDVRYAVGQIFLHDRYDYRAIILSYDPVCMKDDAWQEEMGVVRLTRGANQPFYLAAVDVRDRSPPQRTYVAQEHVHALLSPVELDEYDADYIDHPIVDELFGERVGTRYRLGRHLARLHPDDVDIPQPREEL